jgi:hypothetical protein
MKDTRDAWVTMLELMLTPVMTAGADGRLTASMPVEQTDANAHDRQMVSPLEAVGRGLAGLAPWLVADGLDPVEAKRRDHLAALARRTLVAFTDPDGADHRPWDGEGQFLVDAAFLSHALLRAPAALVTPLSDDERRLVITALSRCRKRQPPRNNWLWFRALVECGIDVLGGDAEWATVVAARDAHREWYKGDGAYGDGQWFHWDYYNSFVIQPLQVDGCAHAASHEPTLADDLDMVRRHLTRYAAIQERMIAPDGSWPVIGRSICYRCGAFQALAQAALQNLLPSDLPPSQVRSALTAAIGRSLEAANTFDADGWLCLGLAGHQPALAEGYISTGSLYLASCAFLPLGLSPQHPFWSGPSLPWTSRRTWDLAQDLTRDHALHD